MIAVQQKVLRNRPLCDASADHALDAPQRIGRARGIGSARAKVSGVARDGKARPRARTLPSEPTGSTARRPAQLPLTSARLATILEEAGALPDVAGLNGRAGRYERDT